MSNYQTRLITIDEVENCFNVLFAEDDKIFRVSKDGEKVVSMISMVKKFMATNIAVMTAVFDMDENVPVAMYTGYKFPTLKGWIVGLTKVAGKYNHFNKSAPIMAPALDLLISEMESQGYYKWWMIAPEQHHNIRNTIMKKHSKFLGDYQWFDEEIIPKGKTSPTQIFNAFRGESALDWTDLTVRLFILNQSKRVDYLRQTEHTDYKGTIVE
jgi:hypothetical protein